MKPSLRPGLSRVNRITIDRERTIGFMGEEARTYATPAMIRDIEYTCRDLIVEHADPGEDSVGMEVAVKHLAPTLMGMTVEIAVRVIAVDGRKVSFEATVKDELDQV
ncbi:MAG: thioesterase family protein, partial [Xanthobacteraceae bacterium]